MSETELDRLLEVEQRLEAQITAEETSARAQVNEARRRSAQKDGAAVLLRREEEAAKRDDLAAHEARLATIAAQTAARIDRLQHVSPDQIDRWARRLLKRAALGGGEAR